MTLSMKTDYAPFYGFYWNFTEIYFIYHIYIIYHIYVL
jgi:hypothetical protein